MSGIYSMSTGFGMRRPMMGNRMSVTTTGGGGGGAPSYPARQPGMFQPKGTSLRDMLMHKGQIGMSGNYAGGQRLTEQEAFDRMPQGGYGINLLGSAGFGGGGLRRRIGSAAGALGSPGTPTSGRGRFEEVMRAGGHPLDAEGYAGMTTHEANQFVKDRTSPLDGPMFANRDRRALFGRILGESSGASGGAVGPNADFWNKFTGGSGAGTGAVKMEGDRHQYPDASVDVNDRGGSLVSKFGTGFSTFGPKTQESVINYSDTYQPSFVKDAQAMQKTLADEAAAAAVPPPMEPWREKSLSLLGRQAFGSGPSIPKFNLRQPMVITPEQRAQQERMRQIEQEMDQGVFTPRVSPATNTANASKVLANWFPNLVRGAHNWFFKPQY